MFDRDAYKLNEKFMTVKSLNPRLVAVLLPIYTVYTVVYLLMWDYAIIFETVFRSTFVFLLELFILAIGIFAFLCVALIIKAGLLSVFSKEKFNSLKFKIISEIRKPHCNLKEPLKVGQYRLCLIVYIFILGVIPYVISLMTGNFMFVIASFICVFFTGTDILFLIYLSGEKSDSYVMDYDGIMLYNIYENI